MLPAVKLTVQHDACPQAGPDRQEDEIVHAASHSLPPLAERGQVDVVLDRHLDPEPALELGSDSHPFEAVNVLGEVYLVGARNHHSRHSDDRPVDRLRRQATGGDQPVAEVAGELEHATRVRARQLDVLTRANPTEQVADGAAQKACPEVEPECQRRVGDGLEERRAVVGAVGAGLRLPDEPGVEQRLQGHGDGRLGDPDGARDLRPRDRRPAADRLEHRALVEVPQQGRRGSRLARFGHQAGPLSSAFPRPSRRPL